MSRPNCDPPRGATTAQRRIFAEQWYPQLIAERQAKALCDGCPIKTACLADALDEESQTSARRAFGIRGGLTPAERRQLMGATR